MKQVFLVHHVFHHHYSQSNKSSSYHPQQPLLKTCLWWGYCSLCSFLFVSLHDCSGHFTSIYWNDTHPAVSDWGHHIRILTNHDVQIHFLSFGLITIPFCFPSWFQPDPLSLFPVLFLTKQWSFCSWHSTSMEVVLVMRDDDMILWLIHFTATNNEDT